MKEINKMVEMKTKKSANFVLIVGIGIKKEKNKNEFEKKNKMNESTYFVY